GRIPQANLVVIAAAGHRVAIQRERSAQHAILMLAECGKQVAAVRGVEHLGGVVVTGGDHALAVGAESDVDDPIGMAAAIGEVGAIGHVEDADNVVFASAGRHQAVAANRDPANGSGVLASSVQPAAGGSVENGDLAVGVAAN